jgi:long-chain acyl-CoA synthetase
MGGTPSILYAVPVSQKKEGESAIYRSPIFKDKLHDRPEENIVTLKDVFINSYKKFANNPALGRNFFIQGQLSGRRTKLQLNI